MIQNEDGTYTVQLHGLGCTDCFGAVYPPEVVESAIKRLQERQAGQELKCEYGSPRREQFRSTDQSRKRLASVDNDNVCCVIDPATIRSVGPFTVANMRPSGPMGAHLEQRLNAELPTFGLRGFVQYKAGNTTRTEGHVVSHLDIVTFDLINNRP